MNDHVINALISLAFFTLAALLLWLLARMNVRERGRRVAREERARAAPVPSGSAAFDAGAVASLDGVAAWQNPHCTPSRLPKDATAWAAGWCYGRQVWRDSWRAED